ncbi:MAG: immunoglobulin domain-containing protein [Thermoplasmata archaeon]
MSQQKKLIFAFLIAMIFIVSAFSPLLTAQGQTSFNVYAIGETETTISLEWTAYTPSTLNSIEGYYVHLSQSGVNGPYSNYSAGLNQVFTFYNLNPNTNYWVYVQVEQGNIFGNSWPSVTPTIQVTTAVDPQLSYTSVTETTVSLSWIDYNVYSNLTSFQSYTVQIMPPSGSWSTLTTITTESDTTYTVSGLSPGNTYYFRMYDTIVVSGVAGSFSSYSNTISVATIAPLSVSISAPTTSVNIGQNVLITSNVQGGVPPYSYQWYENGNLISGATASSFTFSSNSAGTYTIYLKVTDSTGASQGSNDISITVNPTLSVLISSPTASIDVGSSLQLTSQASGGVSPYTYQWYLNGNPISGATSSTFSFDPSVAGTYSIYLAVADSSGLVKDSNTLTITVFSTLNFTASATSTSITNGSSSTFSVNPSGGDPPYSYQWYVNGVPVSGATSSAFTYKPSQTGNYTVYVAVKDSTGVTKDSNFITLTVTKPKPSPSITIPLVAIIGIVIVVIAVTAIALLLSRNRKQKASQQTKTPPPKPPTQ